MKKKDIKNILEKYSSGEFTTDQENMVRLWVFQLHEDDETGLSELNINEASQKIWSRLETITPKPESIVRLWSRIAVAVSVALAIYVGGYFYYNHQHLKRQQNVDFASDVAPGRNSATLTLANGRKIVLSETLNGKVAEQAGVNISKTSNDQVVYQAQPKSGADVGSKSVNILSTSKGEQYQLVLPDGTKVWLNAASSLKFPATFTHKNRRRVELSGEAYFEVAKDKNHPFIVESSGQEVEVLGTHFNISSYKEDKNTKTTLLEGSVKVKPTIGDEIVLNPNQQAEVDGDRIQVKEVKATYAIAWKNGYFMFNNENLETVMTRIARWYNVQIIFADNAAREGIYFGTISRYEDISNVLKMLSKTELVRFKIEGNTVKISKKE